VERGRARCESSARVPLLVPVISAVLHFTKKWVSAVFFHLKEGKKLSLGQELFPAYAHGKMSCVLEKTINGAEHFFSLCEWKKNAVGDGKTITRAETFSSLCACTPVTDLKS